MTNLNSRQNSVSSGLKFSSDRVQTFRRVPPVLPRNFCHPDDNDDDDDYGDCDGDNDDDDDDDSLTLLSFWEHIWRFPTIFLTRSWQNALRGEEDSVVSREH